VSDDGKPRIDLTRVSPADLARLLRDDKIGWPEVVAEIARRGDAHQNGVAKRPRTMERDVRGARRMVRP